MKKTLLFVLILSDLATLATNFILEYHYIKMLKTRAEAQSYCREKFTDLATVDNQDDSDRLLSLLQDRGQYAWIGLHDDLNTWRWLLGNEYYKKGIHFDRWRDGEPNNKFSKENCIMMGKSGNWNDFPCGDLLPSVCYYEPGPSKYILVETKMTWGKARDYCRSTYTELASVRNLSENNDVFSLVTKNTWIGLRRNPWSRWSDQTPAKLKKWNNWNPGQPDNSGVTMESCVVVNTTTGKWWDVDCERKHYFICHKVPVRHKMTFKLKFQSEVDPNDPDVQQQMLEQLHAKLEEKGLSDFKLRWIQTDGQTFHKELKRKKEEGSSG